MNLNIMSLSGAATIMLDVENRFEEFASFITIERAHQRLQQVQPGATWTPTEGQQQTFDFLNEAPISEVEANVSEECMVPHHFAEAIPDRMGTDIEAGFDEDNQHRSKSEIDIDSDNGFEYQNHTHV